MLDAKYTFLPWLKKGMSLYSGTEDNHSYQANVTGRPKLDVTLTVNNNNDITKQLELVGPGDVVGFQSGSILKSWPQPNTPDFQPNHLCFLEFFEEDLPWRYSPAIASSQDDKKRKLRPWIALIVLENQEYNLVNSEELPFPTLQVSSSVIQNAFPSQSELWAWAHVHVNGHFENIDELRNLADGQGDRVYARLMCPRKLKANTSYQAFLIPSYEAGRKVGIGEEPYGSSSIDLLAPAWNKENSGSGTTSFPVYHSWDFSTSENDDFESVIDRLSPQPIPDSVGNLNLDVRQMGPGIDMGSNPDTSYVGMPGALKSPTTNPKNWTSNEATLFKTQLTAWLNQADILRQDGTFTNEGGIKLLYGENANDPVIVPPTYGRYHALIDRIRFGDYSSVVDNPNWIKELNLEIRNRVAASIGASLVREKQEDLMDAAWEQVGDIQEANQRIIQTELAKNANYEAYRKFVFETDDGKIIELTGSIVTKLLSGNETVWKKITGSTLPNASLSGQFRSKKKPRGKKAGFLNGALINQAAAVSFSDKLIENLADDVNRPLVNAAQKKTAPSTFPSANIVAEVSGVISDIEAAYAADPDFEDPTFPKPTQSGGGVVSANTFATADAYFTSATPEAELENLPVGQTTGTIQQAVDPKILQAKRLNNMLGTIGGSFKIIDESYRFKPVLATPEFEFPTYELLKEKSIDLFMPNLDLVPNNSISLLESNYEFIEAFLAGMSHEMGKELLWRSFPTDQRGTNFKYFWERFDPTTFEAVPDISAIHTWPFSSSLGDASHRPADTSNPAVGVVLMLRGDLLKRYPNTVLFAQKATQETYENRLPMPYDDASNRKYPILEAKIDPDISFFGFDISKEEALGNADGKGGWYFVFQERPGEMAFGFDKAQGEEATSKDTWENVDWNDMLNGGIGVLSPTQGPILTNDIQWGENSADIAYALFQKPVRVAIHAAKMIERT